MTLSPAYMDREGQVAGRQLAKAGRITQSDLVAREYQIVRVQPCSIPSVWPCGHPYFAAMVCLPFVLLDGVGLVG